MSDFRQEKRNSLFSSFACCFAVTLLSLLPCLATLASSAKTYTNPVGNITRIGDPFVLKHQGNYYLYATSAGDGVLCWKSDDLVDWKLLGHAYKRTRNSWAQGAYWAPEAVHYKDKFYLAFAGQGYKPGTKNKTLRICLAVADKPEGPFEDLYVPLFEREFGYIDPHIFIDDDGTAYLYYEMVGVAGKPWENPPAGYFWGLTFGVKLSEDLSRFIGEPVLCLMPNQQWEGLDSYARSNEGVTVLKHNGLYYMTYSANHYADPRYGVGYATAPSPLGPWTKSKDNPILKENRKIGVSGPGHNSITTSPDGKELFIVYHTHTYPDNPSGNRTVNIDRLIFDAQGRLKVLGPTRSAQPMPSGAK